MSTNNIPTASGPTATTPKGTTPQAKGGKEPHPNDFKRVMDFIMRYILPMGISVLLLIWFFQKVNFHKVVDVVKHGVEFRYIAWMMVFTILSLVIRGFRWRMQLVQAGVKKMTGLEGSCAIFGAYALNLVFPRLGEAWRCIFISHRSKVPLASVVGTDFGDRISDMLCVFVFIAVAAIVSHTALMAFMEHYAVGRVLGDVFANKWVWMGVAIVVGGTWAVIAIWGKSNKAVAAFHRTLINIWEGFAVLFHLPHLGGYLWLTLGIWVCYFMQTYICFFAFPFTKELVSAPGMAYGLLPGLMCLVFGSCSTIVPSNGGLGPWTIAIAYALELYGIDATDAAAYSLVVWAWQSVSLIAAGLFTCGYIAVTGRKEKQQTATASAEVSGSESDHRDAR